MEYSSANYDGLCFCTQVPRFTAVHTRLCQQVASNHQDVFYSMCEIVMDIVNINSAQCECAIQITCPKSSVGDWFLIDWKLVNTDGELHFRLIQLLPIVLFQNDGVDK